MHELGPTGSGDSDDFDADIARQFELLNQADDQRPALPGPGSANQTAELNGGQRYNDRFRHRYSKVLVAAAAVGGVVALSAVTLVGRSDKQIATAGNAENVAEKTADNAATVSDTTAPSTGDNDVPLVAPDPDTVDGVLASGTSRASNKDKSAVAESGPAGDKPTTSRRTTGSTAKLASTTTSIASTTTWVEATTTAQEPEWTTTVVESGELITVRGVVSVVMTDCVGSVSLAPNGEIVTGGQVLCDAGSHIVVDGQRVQTSSGFVSADQAYDKHKANLMPGQRVSVIASRSNGILSVACGQCGIRLD